VIRLAISGAGAIAERAHIPAFLTIPEIAIVAIQSRTIEKAERVATAIKSGEQPRIYQNDDEMRAPDAVFVC
jgi:predicted dehydrogenase